MTTTSPSTFLGTYAWHATHFGPVGSLEQAVLVVVLQHQARACHKRICALASVAPHRPAAQAHHHSYAGSPHLHGAATDGMPGTVDHPLGRNTRRPWQCVHPHVLPAVQQVAAPSRSVTRHMSVRVAGQKGG
eukprot:CAMPEP_0202905244 /NCGR_PEP_ID=MMETSP1392-20130828/33269_1 /ASSEMBLY_ACC=CAM_ASM_000868 /TAXON_ID=225041 /ORGANISM="Chlamydomonas chlamydogama, Strain SAG 11-48b" /LENGTH=131 /DNA_ID=CAMNT_0049593251 /DNA_START=236 /DNA_END=630 /DNA_ORIENTATION=+